MYYFDTSIYNTKFSTGSIEIVLNFRTGDFFQVPTVGFTRGSLRLRRGPGEEPTDSLSRSRARAQNVATRSRI
eukprot:SAG11_NODE_4990_length_1701_cov_1.780899_1_plen_72_part_10